MQLKATLSVRTKMKSNETDTDWADEGIYPADDVYGATSDFWGGAAGKDTSVSAGTQGAIEDGLSTEESSGES